MATKTFWTTLVAVMVLLSGCASLSSNEPVSQNQRDTNQPQLSELDSGASRSESGPAPSAPKIETTEQQANTTPAVKPPVVSKPKQDPEVNSVKENEVVEPPPSPDQVVIRLQQLALQKQSEGNWQEAEILLQRALRIDVQKVDIYHQLATVRMGQQRFNEAEQIAMKGLTYTDRSPKFKASLWEVIAQCRSAQGDIEGANAAREEMLKWMSP